MTYSDRIVACEHAHQESGADLEKHDGTVTGVADAVEVTAVNGLKSPVCPVPWGTDGFGTVVSEDSATEWLLGLGSLVYKTGLIFLLGSNDQI